MEKDKEEIIDPVVDDNTVVDDEVVDTMQDETLAQTDEVIPAPVDPVLPEIPIDTIPASTSEPLTVEEPVDSDVVPGASDELPTDIAEPIDVPVEEPVPGECPNCEGEGCPVCDGNSIANLFGTMQEAVTIIWKYHLKTRKYSVHIALNDFYDKMLDLVDDVIEQYQGIHGIIEDTFTNCVCADGTSESEYLNNLKAYVVNNRGLAGTESEIQSAFDDILGLIDTTIYKINNLTESKVKSYEEYVYEDYVNECGGHCKNCKNKEDEDLFGAEEEEEE